MRHFTCFILCLLTVGLASCSQTTITSVSLENFVGEATLPSTLTVTVEAGTPIYFWSDFDLEFEDDASLFYNLFVESPNGKTTQLQLDALAFDRTLNSVEVTVNGHKTWKAEGRMKPHWIPQESGEHTLKVGLFSTDEGATFNHVEFLLKK